MALPSQKRKMQIILNKALRFIHCNEQDQLNSFYVHIKYNITHLNITNYRKALNIWETIKNKSERAIQHTHNSV